MTHVRLKTKTFVTDIKYKEDTDIICLCKNNQIAEICNSVSEPIYNYIF